MELKVKTFAELTTKELYEFLKLRSDVFVVEQSCIYPDLDGNDYDSIHVFYERDNGTTAAYLRVFPKKNEEGTVQMGRVVTGDRGTGLGGKLLKEGIKAAETILGAKEIYLEAQTYAIGFYGREGFEVTSDEFLEDGLPHVEMRRKK